MPFYIAYDADTLEIKHWYEYERVLDHDDSWVHTEILPPLHYECVNVVRGEDGTPRVVRDDEKWEEKTQHEMKFIRMKRNELLQQSDISQLDDIKTTMSEEKRTEWANYRRLLRDFPSTVTDPFNPVWPQAPTV